MTLYFGGAEMAEGLVIRSRALEPAMYVEPSPAGSEFGLVHTNPNSETHRPPEPFEISGVIDHGAWETLQPALIDENGQIVRKGVARLCNN